MKDLLILLAQLLTTIAKLLGPGGARVVVADSLLMKQQLLIINRSRQRAPNLTALDHFLLGFWSLFLCQRHIQRAAVIIRPSTLLKFHNLLKQRKYRLLYSASRGAWLNCYYFFKGRATRCILQYLLFTGFPPSTGKQQYVSFIAQTPR
jgi:putative transposase